jgi:Xaa-Pro dipeptidase
MIVRPEPRGRARTKVNGRERRVIDRRSYEARLRAVQAQLAARGMDGLVVVKPEHVRYLSGVWGYSTRPEYAMPRRLIAIVVPQRGEPTLVVPKIELIFARRRTWIADVRHHVEWRQAGEVFGGLALLHGVLKEKSLLGGRIGLELGFISAKLHALLCGEIPTAKFEDASGLVEEIRMIKSPEEIEIMRIGGRMAVNELKAEVAAIRSGVREYELAMRGRDEATRQAAQYTRESNSDLPLEHPLIDGFQIITSGPRLDMVHALASTRRISEGDVVLLDFCRIPQLEHYRIGFSRNAALRDLSKREAEMFAVTMEAYRRAVEILRPGVRAEEPDLVAREVLDKAGLGETYVHRTGRGVGLEGVERPEIGAGDDTELRPGMVVTIEPSVYYPDFAAHVEDTFLITESGCECLTECPREVQVIRGAGR